MRVYLPNEVHCLQSHLSITAVQSTHCFQTDFLNPKLKSQPIIFKKWVKNILLGMAYKTRTWSCPEPPPSFLPWWHQLLRTSHGFHGSTSWIVLLPLAETSFLRAPIPPGPQISAQIITSSRPSQQPNLGVLPVASQSSQSHFYCSRYHTLLEPPYYLSVSPSRLHSQTVCFISISPA